MSTTIAKCTCSHPAPLGQDAIHGPGMRAFNKPFKPTTPYRCTVCGAALYLAGKGIK